MSLLLDTNIVVPMINDQLDDLPAGARDVLDGDEPLVISVASLWEIAIKHRRGKLPLERGLEVLPAMLSALEIRLLEISARHVLQDLDAVPDTKDPFDRLLLSVCKVERLRLVTTDAKLLRHPLAWQGGAA